jgi:hypothetical protein
VASSKSPVINSTLGTVTLKENILSTLQLIGMISRMYFKDNPAKGCLQATHLRSNNINKLNVKEQRMYNMQTVN